MHSPEVSLPSFLQEDITHYRTHDELIDNGADDKESIYPHNSIPPQTEIQKQVKYRKNTVSQVVSDNIIHWYAIMYSQLIDHYFVHKS